MGQKKRTRWAGPSALLLSSSLSLVLLLSACNGSAATHESDTPPTSPVATATPTIPPAQEDPGAADADATITPTMTTTVTATAQITEPVDIATPPAPLAEAAEPQETAAAATPTPPEDTQSSPTDAPQEYVRASTLTDEDFMNLNGDDIGDIQDILIDLNDGAILFLSAEYGGFLDLGDHDIYLPLNAFTIGADKSLYLAIAAEQLAAYPAVDADWPNLDDPTWGAQLDAYWAGGAVEATSLAARPGDNLAWASNLIGFPLLGWGDRQTNVVELLVNLPNGTVEYALVADATNSENVPTEAGPYIVPLQALRLDRATGIITFAPAVTNATIIAGAPRLDPAQSAAGESIDGIFDQAIRDTWRALGFDWWHGE